jgi:hypothetical protein
MKTYYAEVSSQDRGFKTIPGFIKVIESPNNRKQVGTATHAGQSTQDNRPRYTLYVHERCLPGKWILVGDEFQPL